MLLIHPLTTTWYSPCLRGRKWVLRYLKNIGIRISPSQ